ncbi:hypothetical protein EGW08_000921 [Elysia chlorotica]|uniref:HTH psq-type domain-containing protein n=1 Tax=Elysia chlorotica TaxID=188477 RepID=A0A433UBR4_ELYCH|nr:hypothetical protein EGW08_000921 [Elysia chlorotica]
MCMQSWRVRWVQATVYATRTKATLCSISLFNRKRGGEVQRLRSEDFEKGISSVPSDPEIKQVATLSQTLHITKWEQDQLATFLGQDIRVHKNIYRQPLEVLDRAKVAKILLAVNKGVDVDLEKECGANENDEIDCDPPDEIHQEDLESDEGEPESETESKATTQMASVTNLGEETQRNSDEGLKGRQKMKRQPWSEDEIKAVRRHLNHCIVSGIVPRKDQAMKAVAAETCLRLFLESTMPRKYKPKPGARPYNSAPSTSVAQAIDDYKNGGLSQREVCQKYGIPRSSFQNHLKVDQGERAVKKPGGQTILSSEMEDSLVQHLIHLSNWGFPFDTMDLRMTVKRILDKEGQTVKCFKANVPGEDWCSGFMDRQSHD